MDIETILTYNKVMYLILMPSENHPHLTRVFLTKHGCIGVYLLYINRKPEASVVIFTRVSVIYKNLFYSFPNNGRYLIYMNIIFPFTSINFKWVNDRPKNNFKSLSKWLKTFNYKHFQEVYVESSSRLKNNFYNLFFIYL